MRYSMHQSVYLEVLTVKLAKIDGKEREASVQSLQTAPETLNELNDLQRQVKELKDQVKNLLGKTNRGFSDEKTSRPAKKPFSVMKSRLTSQASIGFSAVQPRSTRIVSLTA